MLDKSKRERVHTPGFVFPDIEDSSLSSPSPTWLANFDPPLDIPLAVQEMDSAIRKISTHVTPNQPVKHLKIIIHCSPYNRCIQTAELLLNHILKLPQFNPTNCKVTRRLRIDQALSEWLSENFNLNYLPPNDDGYSMINNINTYLNTPVPADSDPHSPLDGTTKQQMLKIKDPVWSYNQLGHCGDYGEPPLDFKSRCFDYLTSLLQYYYRSQSYEADKETVVFVISHGSVISTLLQMLLNRPVFNEIPLCTPVYFKQSDRKRTVFSLMDYNFNLNKILTFSSDVELFRLLRTPIDMSMINFEDSSNELAIGTMDYTTIIQSPPQHGRSRSRSSSRSKSSERKRRSNTISLGQPINSGDQLNESEKASLRQTRSSKQLHLMNRSEDSRLIDMDKLASYFENFSDSSGSGSEDDFEDVDNEAWDNHSSEVSSIAPAPTPRIPSLSSLNTLMHTNSAANSIKDMLIDPSASSKKRSSLASAFLQELFGKESNNDANSEDSGSIKSIGMSTSCSSHHHHTYHQNDNNSVTDTLRSFNSSFFLGDEGITDSEGESDSEETKFEEGVLSFNARKFASDDTHSDKVPMIDGTFSKVPFNSNGDEDEESNEKKLSVFPGTITPNKSQITLIPSLASPNDNDESGKPDDILVISKQVDANDSLKEILFGTESSNEEDNGWFGFNTGSPET
ncbi:hypothetical protein FOA43_002855 [Brettanomyces nanus]|uniref:Uncharacterized protein n=1 Tax=Eeniella nana TaxID=13502 RepID=A0A875RPV1_EENNA|nr:uncharacterized protein FOA43_002855 [Brettanomyces nanus]QPG75500.1 hypothetical protein FOA43_002855 [Brettanomyces nanus]